VASAAIGAEADTCSRAPRGSTESRSDPGELAVELPCGPAGTFTKDSVPLAGRARLTTAAGTAWSANSLTRSCASAGPGGSTIPETRVELGSRSRCSISRRPSAEHGFRQKLRPHARRKSRAMRRQRGLPLSESTQRPSHSTRHPLSLGHEHPLRVGSGPWNARRAGHATAWAETPALPGRRSGVRPRRSFAWDGAPRRKPGAPLAGVVVAVSCAARGAPYRSHRWGCES
jgi:hypothetical protein